MLFKFSFVALAIAALRQTVHATPLSRKTTNIAASFPKSELKVELVTPHPNVTAGSNGLRPDAVEATFPADLLLCTDSACDSCDVFDLSTIPFNECFIEFFYNSVAIAQSSGQGLPFAVFLTPPNLCATGTAIPAVNECFSTVGSDFDDFIVEA
ncbi:hypothetical protein BN946_scf184938.g46 [Trametes cinnabarina]|uniref:Uncharacterized protein n=1 Tax=Pycnoporus cinnabarinus TaxID=5643 RepID=A0A060S7C7_PYCCI|nr:hypothetical protein BN946_scf184938.g46 [Trametes cinnabarina]